MQTRDYPQFRVRLPPNVDAWLEAQAKQNCRTKNGEFVFRLEKAMKETEAAGNASQA